MSPRRLSDEERTLWKGVTRSIAPLRKPRLSSAKDSAAEKDEPPVKTRLKAGTKAAPSHSPAALTRSLPKSAHKTLAESLTRPAPPPLAPLDRQTKRRVTRGAQSVDGRIDLHGLTQAEAHDALLGFMRSRQTRGCKLVLVITGKGAGGDAVGGRGVLKRMVPLWLEMPELRGIVVGYESASIRHGGEGALYVRLRKGPRD